MSAEEKLKALEEGGAMIVHKKSIAWSALATIVIFILTQGVVFGIWKGSVDSSIQRNEDAISNVVDDVKRLKITTKAINRIEHNLVRLMEANNMRYDYNFGLDGQD